MMRFHTMLGALGLTAVLAPLTALAAQQPLFNGEVFDTGSSAAGDVDRTDGAMAFFDVNRDGVLDVVVDTEDGTVLMTGTADGRYVDPQPLGSNTFGETRYFVIDMNGDGEQDLAALNNHDVVIWIHDGVDALAAPYTVNAAPCSNEAVVADFDGDGTGDIASVDNCFNDLLISLNDGTGQFTPLPLQDPGGSPYGLEAADLNGDGHMDLAFAGNQGGFLMILLLGDGTGQFTQSDSLFIGVGGSPRVGDLDGDGDMDVVMPEGGFHGGFVVVEGDGSGQLLGLTQLQTDDGVDFVELFDANGDGLLDLIGTLEDDDTAHGRGANLEVALADGAGGFLPIVSYSAGPAPLRALVADIDGGGTADFVLSNPELSGVAVLLGERADHVLDTRVEAHVSDWSGMSDAESWDVQGDGFRDLVALEESGLHVYLGDGGSGLTDQGVTPAGFRPVGFGSGDLNDDGWRDVVVASNTADKLLVRLGDGNGGWINKTSVVLATPSGDPRDVVLADMNNDGHLDAVAASVPIAVALNDGNGNLGPPLLAPDGGVADIEVADFDGDGNLDVAGTSNGVVVHFGDGTGALGPADEYPLELTALLIGRLSLADLDGDLDTDIVASQYFSEEFVVLLNDGSGQFVVQPGLESGPEVQSIDIVDLTGDGLLDIVASNGSYGVVRVLAGDGQGGFGPGRSFLNRGIARSLEVSDFNGDLRPDLVLTTSFLPDSVLVMRGVAPDEPTWALLDGALAGTGAQLAIQGEGSLVANTPAELRISGGAPFSAVTLVIGLGELSLPFKGGLLVPSPDQLISFPLGPSGAIELQSLWPAGVPSASAVFWQAWRADPGAPLGLAASRGLRSLTP